MPSTREELTGADRRYFELFDGCRLPEVKPNIIRDLLTPREIAWKSRRYRKVFADARALAAIPLDPTLDWDRLCMRVFEKIMNASLHYLFTGDPAMVEYAREGFELMDACPRPYFTYSTCLGVLDMDLRTAHTAHSLAVMKSCFGDALPVELRRRMTQLVLTRILTPGLEAERTKRYPWMDTISVWRLMLCGGFGIAAMAFADDCPDYRALIEYGIESMLLCAAAGDAAGGWNEGPGYWEYGLNVSVAFMLALRVFTGGQVDLFQHPFYRHTGDFRVFMQTRRGEIWNWSDCGKEVGASTALTAFARAVQNPLYQHAVESTGIASLEQLYLYDPTLKATAPSRDDGTRFFPGVGVLVWRTGFDDRDTFIGVKGGDLPHYNHHCHQDMGSMVVHAAGRELLAEA